MDNYIAVVFPNDAKAIDGLHALWRLSRQGDVVVHSAVVIRKDEVGKMHVATRHTDAGLRVSAGAAIGALLGALAGPAVMAGGATLGAAEAGAIVGGVVGLGADAFKLSEREEASFETSFAMKNGQAAVVADVFEERTMPVDSTMTHLGGHVFRRPKEEITDAALFGDGHARYFYPYDYEPYF